MSKRILIVTPTSKLGGAERNIALLADAMPRDRYQFSLATTFGTEDLNRKFKDLGLDAEEFRYFENPSRILDLFSYVKKIKPDLIHSFLLRGNWIAWALSRRFPDIPWIASERGLDILRPPWKARANRFFLSKANLVLAVSEPVKEILIKRDRLPESLIEVMHGGIPPALPSLPLPWQKLSRPRLVTLAHLRSEKNVELSIKALAYIRSKGIDASLTLIGDGAERPKLTKLASGLNLDVNFAGDLPEGRRLLSHFDLLIIPSKEEGFPNVMLEAWQAVLPVLSTDTGGAHEISGSGNAAYLVDEATLPQKLYELLSNPGELAQYAERGKKRVEDFSITRVVEQLTGIYDRFTSSRSDSGRRHQA